jgi:predicted nucleic acid-binding protein
MEETYRQSYVVDASFILSVLLPDEAHIDSEQFFKKYIQGELDLFSTTLMLYEVTNALYVSIKRKRITPQKARILLKELLNLEIPLEKVEMENVLALSQKYELSAYDASYLSLARSKNIILLSLDKKLVGFSNRS